MADSESDISKALAAFGTPQLNYRSFNQATSMSAGAPDEAQPQDASLSGDEEEPVVSRSVPPPPPPPLRAGGRVTTQIVPHNREAPSPVFAPDPVVQSPVEQAVAPVPDAMLNPAPVPSVPFLPSAVPTMMPALAPMATMSAGVDESAALAAGAVQDAEPLVAGDWRLQELFQFLQAGRAVGLVADASLGRGASRSS